MSSNFKSRFVIPDFKPEDFYNKKEIVETKETETVNVDINKENSSDEVLKETADVIENTVTYNLADIEEQLKTHLFEKLNNTPVWFDYERCYQEKLISDFISNYIKENDLEISDIDREVLSDNLTVLTSYFGSIKYLTDKLNVDAVFINSTKNIYIEIAGKILNTETKLSYNEFVYLLKTIKYLSNTESFNGVENFAIDGFLITLIGKEYITVRKSKNFDADFIENHNIMPKEVFDFIINAIQAKKNILISGEINTYKSVLTDIIIKSCMKDKRAVLLENCKQIISDTDSLIKFITNRKDSNYNDLLSQILKIEPEYIISDMNYIIPELTKTKGVISTLSASSIEDAMKKSSDEYIKSGMAEKSAKSRVLKDIDYIIQLNKLSDGSVKLTYLVELKSAKTLKESIKTLVKYGSNKYTINFEQ